MLVAGVVIQTQQGAAGAVALRLQRVPGLSIQTGDGDSRLAAVWTGPDADTFEKLGDELLAADDAIVGFFPTFVGEDDGE